MKTNRNFRYVLTVVDNDAIAAGEISIQEKGRVGTILFESECHYYCEKEILSCIKAGEKDSDLSGYYNHTYCIYKEQKATKTVTEREEGGKKITETVTNTFESAALLIETITVDENGITIR